MVDEVSKRKEVSRQTIREYASPGIMRLESHQQKNAVPEKMLQCPRAEREGRKWREGSRLALLRHPRTRFDHLIVPAAVAVFDFDRTSPPLVIVVDVGTRVGAGGAAVRPLLAMLRHHRRSGHIRLMWRRRVRI